VRIQIKCLYFILDVRIKYGLTTFYQKLSKHSNCSSFGLKIFARILSSQLDVSVGVQKRFGCELAAVSELNLKGLQFVEVKTYNLFTFTIRTCISKLTAFSRRA